MINLERAREWLGRVDVRDDVAAPSKLAVLYDLIEADDRPPDVGDELPPLAHWLYFSHWGLLSETNESGDFRDPALPPIELPRRLCVASGIAYHRPIRVGAPISRVRRIVDVGAQDGNAGPIVTLLLHCDIIDVDGVAVSEQRRLIYMARGEAWPLEDPRHAPRPAEWTHEFRPSTRSLFRYAALTHNMSRIHYDRTFAVFVERHPGLVVPGDFVSASLLALVREQTSGARIARVDLRVLRWLYDTAPVRLCARRATPLDIAVWAEDQQGVVAIEGLVRLSESVVAQD